MGGSDEMRNQLVTLTEKEVVGEFWEFESVVKFEFCGQSTDSIFLVLSFLHVSNIWYMVFFFLFRIKTYNLIDLLLAYKGY